MYASESGLLRLSNYNLPKFPVQDVAVKCSLANLPLSYTLHRIHFTEFKINPLPDGAAAEVNISNSSQSFQITKNKLNDFFWPDSDRKGIFI